MAEKEYIEREAVLNDIGELFTLCRETLPNEAGHHFIVEKELETHLDFVRNLPAADVRPVVKAHWYWDKDGMDWNIGAWRCSACKTMSPMWWNCDRGSPMHKSGHRFCPNCGARMEEQS